MTIIKTKEKICISSGRIGIHLVHGAEESNQSHLYLSQTQTGMFTHMKMSLLTAEGYKLWPMLGSLGHWALRVIHTYCRACCSEALNTSFNGIAWNTNNQPSACGAHNLTDGAIAATIFNKEINKKHVWQQF